MYELYDRFMSVLPAYAGMIPSIAVPYTSRIGCAPRVCGDDPYERMGMKSVDLVLPAYAGMIPCRCS